MSAGPEVVHATAIALAGRAALLRGASGCGKSDLALRCLGMPVSPLAPAPFRLIADDQVRLHRQGDVIWTSAPPSLSGLIEVRGLGIYRLDCLPEAALALIVDLVPPDRIERLPDPRQEVVLGRPVTVLALDPRAPSAPLKLALALAGQPHA